MNNMRYAKKITQQLRRMYGKKEIERVFGLGTDVPLWKPFPGPQTLALECQAKELFFGGGAGGGKSYLLIGAAMTQHRHSIILRRTAKATEALVESIKSVPNHGKWSSSGSGGLLKTPDGRHVNVGGCQYDEDWENYQGKAYDGYFWDEIAHFTRFQYTTLIGWNRPRNAHLFPDQRCRVIATGNPPTDTQGDWVLKYWAPWIDPDYKFEKAKPNQIRWFVSVDGKDIEVEDSRPVKYKNKIYSPISRSFIPATVDDNPAFAGTDYESRLNNLPEPLRSMFRYGNFGLSKIDDRWQLIPTAWVYLAQQRWIERQKKGFKGIKRIGVDVARSSTDAGDKTALATATHCVSISKIKAIPGKDTPDGQSVVTEICLMLDGNPIEVNLDVTGGLGSSPYDLMKQQDANTTKIIGVNFGSGTNWTDRKMPGVYFSNTRSAMYWNVRALLDPEGGDDDTRLALPPDNELLVELTAPRYELRNGKIFVESKENKTATGGSRGVRARLGRSPDKADAVVLALWEQKKPTIFIV